MNTIRRERRPSRSLFSRLFLRGKEETGKEIVFPCCRAVMEKGFSIRAGRRLSLSLFPPAFDDGVAAEFVAQSRQHLIGEGVRLTGAEALENGGGDDRGGDGQLDGLLNGPCRPSPESSTYLSSAKKGWGLSSGRTRPVRGARERTTLPWFQRWATLAKFSLFPVGGSLHELKAFAVGRHHAVFDAVVGHLDEMAGAGASAIEAICLWGPGP